MRVCSVPDCGQPHRCKGYCEKHYYELWYGPIVRSTELAFVDISPAWQNALASLIRQLPSKDKAA